MQRRLFELQRTTYHPGICLERVSKIMKSLSIQPQDRNSNLGHPQNKAIDPMTQPRRSTELFAKETTFEKGKVVPLLN
jgi:hypothetical protein